MQWMGSTQLVDECHMDGLGWTGVTLNSLKMFLGFKENAGNMLKQSGWN